MGSSKSISPRLVIIEGNDKGKTFHLSPGAVVLGRSKSDIIINDARISREHVRLEFDSESQKLLFTDLKSLNGCQINGVTLISGELKDGDKLQIGNTILDCQMAEGSEMTEELRKEPILKTGQLDLSSHPSSNSDAAQSLASNSTSSIPFSMKDKAPIPKKQRPLLYVVGGCLGLLILWASMSSPPQQVSSSQNGSFQLDLYKIRQLLAGGEMEKALSGALSLNQTFPRNPEIEEFLGDIYSQSNQLEPCIQNYKSSLEHKNPSTLIHFKLTKAYLRAGLVALAIQQLNTIDKIIKDSKQDKDLFVEFANILLTYPELNQSVERAIVIAKSLQTDIAPDNTIGYRLEATTLIQLKKLKEAEALYERALALAPNDTEVLEELSMTKLNLQDLRGAKEITERWLKQNPSEVKALLAVSYLDFYEKNYLATIPKLNSVITQLSNSPSNPRRIEALHLLGLVYWEQGQRAEAETYLAESCKLGFQQSCNHPAVLTQDKSQTNSSKAPNQP